MNMHKKVYMREEGMKVGVEGDSAGGVSSTQLKFYVSLKACNW